MSEVIRRWPTNPTVKDLSNIPDEIIEAIKADRRNLLTAIKAAWPEKKPLKTDLPLDALEDDEKFCVECGQYEYEGKLDCKCVGFNEAVDAFNAIIDRHLQEGRKG